MLPLFCLAVVALLLLSVTLTSEVESALRRTLLITAVSAIGFTAGLLYGTFGVMGFYEINDPIYMTLVIAFTLGTVVAAVRSLVALRSV